MYMYTWMYLVTILEGLDERQWNFQSLTSYDFVFHFSLCHIVITVITATWILHHAPRCLLESLHLFSEMVYLLLACEEWRVIESGV